MSVSGSLNELGEDKTPTQNIEDSINHSLNTTDIIDNTKGNHAKSIEGIKSSDPPTNEKTDNNEENQLPYQSPRTITPSSGVEINVHPNDSNGLLVDNTEKDDNTYQNTNGNLKGNLQTSSVEFTKEFTNERDSAGKELENTNTTNVASPARNNSVSEINPRDESPLVKDDDDRDSFFDETEVPESNDDIEEKQSSTKENTVDHEPDKNTSVNDDKEKELESFEAKENTYEEDFEDENLISQDPDMADDKESSQSALQGANDTLEDIEPLTTAEEPQKEGTDEQVEHESDKTKSEIEKSTDDNARADEMTKNGGDDTDNEAEDIRSDDTLTDKQRNKSPNESQKDTADVAEEKSSSSETTTTQGEKKRKRHSHELSHQHEKKPERKVTFETPGKSRNGTNKNGTEKKTASESRDDGDVNYSQKQENKDDSSEQGVSNRDDAEKSSVENETNDNSKEASTAPTDDVDTSARTVDSIKTEDANSPFVHETVEERVFMTADEEEDDASKKKEDTSIEEEAKTDETIEQDAKVDSENKNEDKNDAEQDQEESESIATQEEKLMSERKDEVIKDEEEEGKDENDISQKTDDSSRQEVQEDSKVQEEPETLEEPETEPEPEPEPEPIKITRNVNIDDAVDTLTSMEDKVTDLLADMKVLMDYYHENLTSKHLSEFVDDLDKFRGDFQSLRDAYKKCESLFTYFNKSLKDLRGSGEQLNSLMDKKFREEDLEMWIESEEAYHDDKSKLKEERVAIEKSALAKATEAKAAVARASVAISESSLYAAEAEAAAGEAVGTAKRAWECAEVAKLEAEEARKAAIEKKKVEEEARKRAEERARKKAEEERLKQEEEDKKLKETADAKGTSFEDEKRKAMAEKARREAERKNPKNWPRYVYSVEPGDYDPGVGCVIRAIDGSMTRDDVEVSKVSQLLGTLKLVENEELISNIIEIKAKDPEKKIAFDEPMSIAIPHCLQRAIIGREPIIKQFQPTGRWTELPTSDVIFDDIRELRFVEIRSRRFGIFAVVLRLKKDVLTLHKKGNKVNSTVDARVSFTCKPGTFKNNVNFSCEVQAVDSGLVNDLSSSRADCSSLQASSPIVRTHIPNRKLSKTLVIAFPLPTAQNKLKRPQTAPVKKESEPRDKDTRPVSERPLTSFSTREEKPEEEELHLLCRDDKGSWTVLPKVTVFQPKNKDIVLFEIDEPRDRLVVLKTKEGISPMAIERMAAAIENAVLRRSVRLILRQKSHDPAEVNVSCVPSVKVDKALKRLADEGFDDGPAPSKEIIIKEGQILEIQFRGNVRCVSNPKNPNLVFNTYIRSRVKFSVEEIDKFAQKSFEFYRGFAQVFSNLEVPVAGQSKTTASGQKAVIEMTKEFTLLSDLLISIPKPEPEPPKPLNTAPVKINSDGPRKEDVFEYVASELGDEWKKLAQYLCLKTVRIQAILRQNNQNPDPKKVKYDMLVTWAKRIPRSVNKLEMLAQALMACGRGDVALELRERDQEYRRLRAMQFREVYLRRAFVKVAQNPDAVTEWKSLATSLGVPETEVIEIDRSKPSVQEKCFQSLQRWQDTSGESATLPVLAEQLKTSKYKQLARDIEAIGFC